MISLAAWAIAVTIGLVLGVLGSLPGRVKWLLTAYVSLFRNVPLLVQLLIWLFVVPELLPSEAGRWLKRELPMPELWTAIAALGLFTASRVAVQVRSGIAALPRGQRFATFASGMTLTQAYRFILLPQALRLVLPPLTSEFLTVFKNSALALTIGVFEMTAKAARSRATPSTASRHSRRRPWCTCRSRSA